MHVSLDTIDLSRIWSHHVARLHIFIYLWSWSPEAKDVESVEWLERAILRRTATSVVEVSNRGRLPLSPHFRTTEHLTVWYMLWTSATHLRKPFEEDRIGVWTRGMSVWYMGPR